jgi:aspartate/methionine/tyrosine aminotransferase
MSKSLSLPGLRIGWLASRDKALLAKWRKYKDYTTICSSAPSEVLALMALRARDVIVSRNLGIIQANLEAAEHFFGARAKLFSWLPPQAGSVAFIQWIGPGASDDFCLKSVREQGVMVVPGSMFESDGQYFRIGLGRKNFSAALARLENVL